MRELRSVVMILVEATWEDEGGVLQRVPACMEGRSASGACLGVKTPIALGSKLMIQWRFFGNARESHPLASSLPIHPRGAVKHIHNLAGGAGGGRSDDRADPQDANAHREALHRYEKEQQKGLAAEWARKAEDNTQIDAV